MDGSTVRLFMHHTLYTLFLRCCLGSLHPAACHHDGRRGCPVHSVCAHKMVLELSAGAVQTMRAASGGRPS